VIDPLIYKEGMTRYDLYAEAARRVAGICQIWGIPVPKLNPFPNPRVIGMIHGSGGMHYGLYMRGEIWVNVKDATSPAKVRGRVWSYPGNKTDRTASGILFHELGHHVQANIKMDPDPWREIVDKHKAQAVSGYEPIYDESFAETMRLFSTNPDLLRRGSPLRYEYVTRYLRPWHSATMDDVLANAPDFIRTNAEKWGRSLKGSPAPSRTPPVSQPEHPPNRR
jgi:hypothetical protein